MDFNKDLIIRIFLGLAIFIAFVKIVIPIVYGLLKEKITGTKDHNPHDIDYLISKEKEKLKHQFKITEAGQPLPTQETNDVESPLLKDLGKQTNWGGGAIAKEVQAVMAKNFSYTMAENKVNFYLGKIQKSNYYRFLSTENQNDQAALVKFSAMTIIYQIMIEEIRAQDLAVVTLVARKCHVNDSLFALAIQLKVFSELHQKHPQKDEKRFSRNLAMHFYSEETLLKTNEAIIMKEANLWAKDLSLFYEELNLFLSYAEILIPYPKFKDKNDLLTAFSILGIEEEQSIEEVKKAYKKLVLSKHPDRIGQMKLPPYLEKIAVQKFNEIQNAYEIIVAKKSK